MGLPIEALPLLTFFLSSWELPTSAPICPELPFLFNFQSRAFLVPHRVSSFFPISPCVFPLQPFPNFLQNSLIAPLTTPTGT